MPLKSLVLLLIAWIFATASSTALGQQELPRTLSLTAVDREFMGQQRDSVDALSRARLGRQVRGEKENDLEVLQQLLDRSLVRSDEVLLLQAMGIVLGDLLSEELKMPWVVYEDELGRSRALRLGLSEHYLFPVTMISRRAEVGARVDVRAIYARAVAAMQPHLPPKPFQ